MRKRKFQLEEFEKQDILCLMDVYLNEWIHRSDVLWGQTFKYFYATLVVLFLPNLAERLEISLPKVPVLLFPIIALILSGAFLYATIGYCKRLEASGKTYKHLIEYLPVELRRVPLDSPDIKYGKIFSRPMSIVLCSLMFFSLFLLSIAMLLYYLHN